MGKSDDRHLPLHQHQLRNGPGDGASTIFFGERCSIGLSRIFQRLSFKCFFVVVLSFAVFLSAVFWILPRHSNRSGFDASDSIKLNSSVQASFKLDKKVSDVIPYIARLEYSIYEEIGVPFTKVVVLYVHQAGISNHTNVTFGVLSDPIDTPINSASLSLLRSSLLDVFLQQANLILTTSIFGHPSSFQILKFPGGVTLNPESESPFWQEQILFHFTLNNSIGEIKENFAVFKEQLRSGLHLRHYENVFVQVNSRKGSTVEPPVRIEASIVSDAGYLTQERLRELAQIITGSPPTTNLGLDNSVFGKVKEVSLSSVLNHSLQASSPSPSPSPAPAHLPYFTHLTPNCDSHVSPPSDANHHLDGPTHHPLSPLAAHAPRASLTSPPQVSPSISSSLPSCKMGMCFINLFGALTLLTYWI